jgi:hypothetical protein
MKHPSYKLTDEGIAALVEGRLKCTSVPSSKNLLTNKFMVQYDTIVIGADYSSLTFQYDGVSIMSLELPVLGKGDTLTIQELDGKISLSLG